MHRSHLPLEKWFKALYMIRHMGRHVPQLELAGALGVTQKTACLIEARIQRGELVGIDVPTIRLRKSQNAVPESLPSVRAPISTTDDAMLERRMNACRSEVYRFALRQTRSADDAEEAVQRAMLVAWEKRGQFDSSRGSVGAWLTNIARYELLHARNESRRTLRDAVSLDLSEGWIDNIPDTTDIEGDALAAITEREKSTRVTSLATRIRKIANDDRHGSLLIDVAMGLKTRDESMQIMGWTPSHLATRIYQLREKIKRELAAA